MSLLNLKPETVQEFITNKIESIRFNDKFIIYEFPDSQVRVSKEKTSQLLVDMIRHGHGFSAIEYNKSVVENVLRRILDTK